MIPDERILAVGDLVVFPVPYGSGSFPGDWVEVMRGIAGMEAARRALVPFFLRPVVSRTLELADGGSGGC